MCGFAGYLTLDFNSLNRPEEIVARMALAIAHRGPDDSGVWVDAQAGIALGHQRLSIIDLSAAGHQPMHSLNGRYVMVFNGEIYNHLDLRLELEKKACFSINWQGYSDTETLLAGFELWGVEATLKQTVGMFAIALWDREEKSLILARDRFGEKPLYYGWVGNGANIAFVFGSELKAIRAYPGYANPLSREALALYMRFSYVPAPHSIYHNIFKLEPGCVLDINSVLPPSLKMPPSPPAMHEGFSLRRWWSLEHVAQSGVQNQITDDTEAVIVLEERLTDAVRLQSLADVSVGAFLSGGIDSSTIVAVMQQQARRPIKTFTVGFEEAGFDESYHARAVANHLGTDHSELFVTAVEAQSVIPKLPAMYDEPFADSSQIPTHLICKAARQHVTVSLSGDAGDELFGGYNRYILGTRIWHMLSFLPIPVRQTLSKTIAAMPVSSLDTLGKIIGVSRTGEKLQKLGNAIYGAQNLSDFYSNLVSQWHETDCVVKMDGAQLSSLENASNVPQNLSNIERMMYIDSITYLPDDILCKVDRAAMSISLETRVPFLDHRLAELAWQLPMHMKIRGNEGKWLLRQILYKYVPRELIDRPKTGFSIPLGNWLRGPMRDWAESLLAEDRLEKEGYLHPSPIRKKWKEHLTGQRDHTSCLWTVLMFQAWLEEAS
jgi:asparagine synthase (glutamine-hydrolysing)